MYGAILGFQKRVWCPKWTPASSISRMLTDMDTPKVVSRIRLESATHACDASPTPFISRVRDFVHPRGTPPDKPDEYNTLMTPDLLATRAEIAARRNSAQSLLDASLAAARGAANRHSFVRRFDEMAQAAAR